MIEVHGLSKSFYGADGETEVLKDVSLSVRRGEIFGIIGRSGAGKSTLVRCINLLERPDRGTVVVNGLDITALSGADLRRARQRIGMIFQLFNLLSSRTVYDNIAFPLELAGQSKPTIQRAVEPLLELVGLADKRERYPAELSGGQKQRVGIARALASNPTVLLSDEATSALDPETTTSILELLKDINRKLGLTIVLITHEMAVIKEVCERVAVIDRGSIIEQGRVFDVFTAPQAEVTRSIVRNVVDRELPAVLKFRLKDGTDYSGHPVLRIVFTGAAADHPIMSEIVRRFDVMLNILQGHVDYIQDAPYGNIIVEAIGSGANIQAAIDYIRNTKLSVEVIGHVAGFDRAVA